MTRPPVDLSSWVPRGVDVAAAEFARTLVSAVAPTSWARARSLAWAASRLCDFALECGLEVDPVVILSPSFIERFMLSATPRWSSSARRCARTNLYFLARRFGTRAPEPVRLPRERAMYPYSVAELSAYLALADAQATPRRRWRASGLIALGAGAGLIGADLRLVSGRHVHERSGGVVVEVTGAHPRVVPVRRELAPRALAAAREAADGFMVGGADPGRRNVTSALIASLAKGPDLERLSLARLRATWVARCAADIGLATFMAAAGVRCSQRLGDVVATLEVADEASAVALLSGR